MNLHDNRQLFADAIMAASQRKEDGGLGINQVFIEKDYWITRSLKMLSESRDAASAVFKGGTSISKAFGLGARFSEDIDIAITTDSARTDNQTKSLISRIAHAMSAGLTEVEMPDTRKFSKYRKAYYRYPGIGGIGSSDAIKSGIIQLEIVSFANPYPYLRVKVGSLLRDFLLKAGRQDVADEYGLGEFEINVLDLKRTAVEKVVSLVRQSLSDDYVTNLIAKIRHFYDLHFLWQDEECRAYLHSDEFRRDFSSLLSEDQARFRDPSGWQGRGLADSPLVTSLDVVWARLAPTYESELPELAYRQIPGQSEVFASIREIFKLL